MSVGFVSIEREHLTVDERDKQRRQRERREGRMEGGRGAGGRGCPKQVEGEIGD
jgi:hypothetical protein